MANEERQIVSGIAKFYDAKSLIGKKVVVVEDGFIGSGETGRTTAQLVTALDQRFYEMEEIFGKESTKLIAESHKEAIEFVKYTIAKENIDCDFQ